MSNGKTSNKERMKIPQIIGHEKAGTVAEIGYSYIRRNLKFRGIGFLPRRSKIPGPSASSIWPMREKSEGRPQSKP
jgi:hypothetical protein